MKIAFVTADRADADDLARRIVESRLAACVNVVGKIVSHYRWEGEHHADEEALLIAKLSERNAEEFVERVRAWHSYDCPEVVLYDVTGGNPDYMAWVEHEGADRPEA